MHLIELFTRPDCPACPRARQRLRHFAAGRRDLRVIERDFDWERAAADRYLVFATPATVIDGRTVLYGVPTEKELTARCGARAKA
jgi:hypothetical protein